MSASDLHRRYAAVAGAVRGAGAAAAAVDARRLPQSALPGGRAAHQSADPAAAAHPAAGRQGRHRLGGGGADRRDRRSRHPLRAARHRLSRRRSTGLQSVALEIARTLLWTYFYAIFLYALLSLIAPGGYSPLQSVLATLCEPVLRPFRRLIPPIAGHRSLAAVGVHRHPGAPHPACAESLRYRVAAERATVARSFACCTRTRA